MKKTIILIGTFLLLIVITFSSASAQMMGGQQVFDSEETNENHTDEHVTLDEFLPELLEKYNVNIIQELECDVISDDDFEKLGDAVMEENHPGEAHEVMDRMMGGEGSENLRAMHENMGRNYLGCVDGKSFSRMGMGAGMMGRNFNMPMMLDSNQFAYNTNNFLALIWILNSVLITILLVILIRYFWMKGGGKK